jgi:hypothetical protein
LGIAVAALISTVAATLYLAFATRKQCGLKVYEIIILMLYWIIFTGACIALNAGSQAAMVCAVLALGVMGWAQVKSSSFSI